MRRAVLDRFRRRDTRPWLLLRPGADRDRPWQWRRLPGNEQGSWPPPAGHARDARIALVIPAAQYSHFDGRGQGLQGLADLHRQNEHAVQARFEVAAGTLQLSGDLQPQATLAPLLVQAGLLKADTVHFEKTLRLH